MSTSTYALLERNRDQYIVRGVSDTPSTEPETWRPATTGTVERTLRGMRIVVPLVALAAFATPQLPIGVRRRYSGNERSRSETLDLRWAPEEWQYSEEWGTVEQVAALNALLALPAREGFSLDPPD
jgi:hypothetical protein